MFYWREANFKGLAAISESLAKYADLKHFADYLRLRERGLRKQAFLQLEKFLEEVSGWSDETRRRLVDRLMLLHREWPDVFDLIPTPLRKRLIDPVLDKWIDEEPANPIPLRWRGRVKDLRQAIELDPTEQIAREALATQLLYQVDYSIHELPSGYLGDAAQDLEKLKEVELLAKGVHSQKREPLLSAGAWMREVVEAYIAYKNSASGLAFGEWMQSKGRKVCKRWQYHPFVQVNE